MFAQHLSHGSDLVARNARRLRHSPRSAAERGQAAATAQVERARAPLPVHFGPLPVKPEEEAIKGVNVAAGT